jgi:thiol-disulfide isomerase/thioredoxin
MVRSSVVVLAFIALVSGTVGTLFITDNLSKSENSENTEKSEKIKSTAVQYLSKGRIDVESLPPQFRTEFQAWLDSEEKVPLSEAVSKELIAYLDALPDDPNAIRNPAAFTGTLADLEFAKLFYLPDPSLALSETPLQSPDGSVSISDLKGSYTLLAFWASWCAPCLSELPHLAELEKEFGPDSLRLIAVQSEEPDTQLAEKTQRALAKAGVADLTHWRDGGPKNLAQLLATGGALPLTILIGPDGKEIGRQTGVIRFNNADEDETQWSMPEAREFFTALVRSKNTTP